MLSAVAYVSDKLAERNATLFLGAGVNADLLDEAGVKFPLGQGLSDWIASDLLDTPDLGATLDETAEMARYRVGDVELNRYLYERFKRFRPGSVHHDIVRLPWDVIYTTNYDLLIEEAAREEGQKSAGFIRTVFSLQTSVEPFSEQDIIYYKLHGSIDYANTPEGRLILTKEDYRYYERHRRSLFRRLVTDLQSRAFLFVGYSLRDPNFRAILEDCREELGTRSLPLSFATRPGFTDVEAAFWKEKYNLELLDVGGTDLLHLLRETWEDQQRSVIPFEERRVREFVFADKDTRFARFGNGFLRVEPKDCTGASNPALFFHGAEPSWGDIRDRVPPLRDAYWTLLDAIFPELVDPTSSVSLSLVTGAAGTGKTTLLFTAAFDIARDFNVPVLLHVPGTPLDASGLEQLVDSKNLQRIVVIVRHAAEYVRELEDFIDDARRRKLPITIVAEERQNQWLVASNAGRRLDPAIFELGQLSLREITEILDRLEQFRLLGKLSGTARDYQIEHFESLAGKELIVALRELTTDSSFDEIIRDEYSHVPSEIAKRAYVYVAALGQLDLGLRYETLVRILDIRYEQLRDQVFKPTEGVLISGEELGSSRHNAGYRLRARHPVIASVIFAMAAPDDEAKFQVLNAILLQLDPGYLEDRRLLDQIVRRRELVNTFASPENRRAIYERLASLLPGDPFVLQHRSILERELGNPDLCVKYAQEAVAIERTNPALQNSLGMAFEFAARHTEDELKRRALIKEAGRIFDENIRRDPANAYPYIGKANILRQEIDEERDRLRRASLHGNLLSLLEEAYEITNESPIIASELGRFKADLGDVEAAADTFAAALERKPTDTRIRDLLIKLRFDQAKYAQAKGIAQEGIKLDPNSWRLQRHMARILRSLNGATNAVRGHYEAALRHRKGDVGLAVELGSYLFMSGLTGDAKAVFSQASGYPVGHAEKTRLREWWQDGPRKKEFGGKVKSIRGARALALAVPENFEASFWRNEAATANLREGDPIRFSVGFNAYGATARILARSNGR